MSPKSLQLKRNKISQNYYIWTQLNIPNEYKRKAHNWSQSSSSRMRVINCNWSAMKQRPRPQSVAEISRHLVLSGLDSTMWKKYK